MSTCPCSGAGSLFSFILSPERLPFEVGCLKERQVAWYKESPGTTRTIACGLAVVIGIIKPLAFPILMVVGLVALPISLLVRKCTHQERRWCDHLGAGFLCVTGIVATGAFLIVTAYYCPLTVSASGVAFICAVSITYHVYRAVRRPDAPPPKLEETPPQTPSAKG